MNKSLDVQYITTTKAKLDTIPRIAGQLIALMDRSICYYDMMDDDVSPTQVIRRKISGVDIVYQYWKDPNQESNQYTHSYYNEGIYILFDSKEVDYPSGVYIYIDNEYHCIATLNSDENVKVAKDADNKMYLTGSPELENDENYVGHLLFKNNLYVDEQGVLHADEISGKISEAKRADTAKKADTANVSNSSKKAESDNVGNNIAATYIKQAEANDKVITFTRGDGTQFTTEITEFVPVHVLDVKDNLDDAINPGLYTSVNDNKILNKPKDVNSFSLYVLPTSDTDNYIVQKMSASGEPWPNVEDTEVSIVSSTSVIQSDRICITLRHTDYVNSGPLGSKHKTYNYLDTIILYTKRGTIPLREFLGDNVVNAMDAGGTVQILHIFPKDSSIMGDINNVYVREGTVFPSYAYCNNSDAVKKGYVVSNGYLIGNDGKLQDSWTEVVTSSGYYYNHYSSNLTVSSGLNSGSSLIAIQFRSNDLIASSGEKYEVYVNDKKVYTGSALSELTFNLSVSEFVQDINEVMIKGENGKRGVVYIKNENGLDSKPSGDSSSNEYIRKRINNHWTGWSNNSKLEWEDA